MHVESSTGCVHKSVSSVNTNVGTKYNTVCNHRGFLFEEYHQWKKTSKEVTCKRCLKRMGEA